jgi:hypothetical protein
LVTCDRLIEMDVAGYVIQADHAQGGRVGSIQGRDPASLAGCGLVQQPDGQAGIARLMSAFGLS